MLLAPFTRTRRSLLAHRPREMEDVVGRFFEDWDLLPFRETAFEPVLDIAERPNEFVVKGELPGMKPEDISISVRGNLLTISGEKIVSEEDRSEEFYHVERRYGAFRRVVELPGEVDVDKIEATDRDGILTIRLPKTAEARVKEVKIKSS
jgi:HSP20 family protein